MRARDVQLLFADASTGAHSPAIVGQGKIGELIAAKPVDRRALLEEAAGISGLHNRRHEAELRLRAAEQNLVAARRRDRRDRTAARRAQAPGAPGDALPQPLRRNPQGRGDGPAPALARRRPKPRGEAEAALAGATDVADRRAERAGRARRREQAEAGGAAARTARRRGARRRGAAAHHARQRSARCRRDARQEPPRRTRPAPRPAWRRYPARGAHGRRQHRDHRPARRGGARPGGGERRHGRTPGACRRSAGAPPRSRSARASGSFPNSPKNTPIISARRGQYERAVARGA